MLQPQSAILAIFKEIIDELNEIVLREGLDEHTRIRKLHELEARALDLKDRGEIGLSFSALGSIAAARGDADNMKKYHKISIQHLPHPVILRNYAVSMKRVGLVSEASAFMEKVCKDNPGDKDNMDHLVRLCYEEGDEQRFVKFAKVFQSMTGTPHPCWEAYLQDIEEARTLTRVCTQASLPSLLRQ